MVIITVTLRPIVSPIHPKINAPIGLNKYVVQKVKAESNCAAWGSYFGKKAH